MTKKIETPVETVNKSGFPLQIRVAYEVETTRNQHGWRVLHEEHSWVNKHSGTDGFIDLVLEDQHKVSKMVVECKKAWKSSWIFLVPTENHCCPIEVKKKV